MHLKALNWSAALTFVAGGGMSVAFALGGPHWTALGPAVAAAAALLKAALPSQSIVKDAPVVDETGKQVATNISDTSTVFQKAGN